jgi:hypothetical protein
MSEQTLFLAVGALVNEKFDLVLLLLEATLIEGEVLCVNDLPCQHF